MSARGTIATLGLFEALRLARHPLVLAGTAGAPFQLQLGLRGPAVDVFNALTVGVAMYLGPTTYFAANLASSRDRRAGTTGLLIGMPTGERARVLAALMSVAGPVVVAAGPQAAAFGLHALIGSAVAPESSLADVMTAPLIVLGGGLLGVATSRWLPWPGGAAMVMAVLVAWSIAVLDFPHWQLLAPWGETIRYDETDHLIGRFPGSIAWHNAYLLALSAMAAIGALLATPVRGELSCWPAEPPSWPLP